MGKMKVLIFSLLCCAVVMGGYANAEITMKKELTYEEAQALAVKLANEEFAKKEFHDPLYKKNVKGRVLSLVGKVEGSRWVFRHMPPAGSWAEVSFDLHGLDPEVKVGWSPS